VGGSEILGKRRRNLKRFPLGMTCKFKVEPVGSREMWGNGSEMRAAQHGSGKVVMGGSAAEGWMTGG